AKQIPAVIEGYRDANWKADIKDSRSTNGYVFTLGGDAISWKSSKQSVIAKSMMESKFIALESPTRILNMVLTKKVDKTPYELCGRAIDLVEIQDEDTSPSEITSEIPMEVEGFEPPQEEVILVRRSERTHRAPNRLCLNIEANEHGLEDLNEPTSYKAAMLDSESNK
nr:retrovirus-related Pol polyprotein from transposon TNT 1-94 [Tanacetum cinerariifolium]